MSTDRPIRVLHICTIALTARVFIAPVARYLLARGYEVAIACSLADTPDGPRRVEDGELGGMALRHVNIPRTINPVRDLAACWRLYRLIKRYRPAIVHTQTSKAGMIGRIAAYCAGTPIVIHTAHAFPFHASLHPLVRRLYVVLERWAARFADLIMVDTESVKQDGLRADVVQDHTKLVVVPMGIDLKKFSPSSHRPDTLRRTFGLSPEHLVVGTVARLVLDKGLECFLQMAALVRAARPDARFLIVGEGPLRQALEQQATALHLNEAVIFAGHRTDIPALMEVMDIFVLPTRREGFGVVFAEAMAMKKATVGSRIGPISEVVKEGVTGYLAEPDRPEEFARHVVELLGDASKRYAFGMAGRRRVEECFSESLMCERVETHYRRLLAHKGLAS